MTKVQELKYRKQLKTKLLTNWSIRVRDAGANQCAVCGAKEHLNAHHILPKEGYHQYAYADWNGICLCPTHHKFGRLSAHKNPMWFADYIRHGVPYQYEDICRNVLDDNIELTTGELEMLTLQHIGKLPRVTKVRSKKSKKDS